MSVLASDKELEKLTNASSLSLEKAMRALMRAKLDGTDPTEAKEKIHRLISQTLAMSSLLGRRRVILIARARARGRKFDMAAERGMVECFHGTSMTDDNRADIAVFLGTAIPTMVPRVEFEDAVNDLLGRYPTLARGFLNVQRAYAKGHAFALAKSTDETLTRKIQAVLGDSIRSGLGRSKTKDIIAHLGDWSKSYAEVTYTTNATTAYTGGVLKQSRDPDIAEVLPALEFSGRRVPPSRHNHIAAVGLIAGNRDQIWARCSPPLGYRCLAEGTLVSGRFTGGSKAWYSGPAVEIHTLHGTRLTVTGNHPVLTPRGWVPANDLREGDQLLRHLAWREPLVLGAQDGTLSDPRLEPRWAEHHEQMPAPVEQVFETLGTQGLCSESVKTMVGSLDFHGDAKFIDREIEVVGSYIPLPLRSDPAALQGSEESQFILASPTRSTSDCLGRLDATSQWNRRPTRGSPSLAEVLGCVVGISAVPRKLPVLEATFGCTAKYHPSLLEPAMEALASDASLIVEGFDTFTGSVPSDQFIDVVRCRDLLGDELESPLGHPSNERASGDPQLFDEIIESFPTDEVTLDVIVNIRRFGDWHGHVYDLQSTCGWMVAEGVVVSNCSHGLNNVDRWDLKDRGLLQKDGSIRPYFPAGFAAAGPDLGFDVGSNLDARFGL